MKPLAAILALALALCGCAPKAIVVEPVAPVAAKAHTLAVKSSAAAREIRESATITEQASVSLGFQVSQALAEADRQRQAADLTPEQREMNFQTLTRIAAAAVEVERSAKHDAILAAAHEAETVALADVTGDVAEAAVKSDKTVALSAWNGGAEVHRNGPTVAAAIAALGLTDEQVDEMFRQGAALTV